VLSVIPYNRHGHGAPEHPFIDTTMAGIAVSLGRAHRTGESLEFEVADASGGQLGETSAVGDVSRPRFHQDQSRHRSVFIDGAERATS